MNYLQALLSTSAQICENLTYSDFAKVLNKSRQTIYNNKDNEIAQDDIVTLEKEYGVVLGADLNMVDSVPIQYFTHPNLKDITKSPWLTTFSYDREILKKWDVNGEDLRIVRMLGDTMDGGERPIQNEDVIIIDTNSINPMFSGVYAYVTNDYHYFFINGIRQKANGSLEFYFHNPRFDSVIYTREELREMDFKIIGRMIKNATYKM